MFDVSLNLDPDIKIDDDSSLDKQASNKIFWELELYLKKNITEISRCYHEEKKQLETIENEIYEKSDPSLIERYYNSVGYFLYSMSYWEATRKKQLDFKKLLFFCKKKTFRKVLDFGGGVGGLAIFLTRHGIDCDYLDVPGETFDYAIWRFEHNKIKNKIFHRLDDVPSDEYEAVFSWDVFEHLYNFEETLSQIHRILNKKGYCIFKATFSGGKEHLKCNEKYQDFSVLHSLFLMKGFKYAGRIKTDFLSSFLYKLFRAPFILKVRLQKQKKYGGNFLVFRKKEMTL